MIAKQKYKDKVTSIAMDGEFEYTAPDAVQQDFQQHIERLTRPKTPSLMWKS